MSGATQKEVSPPPPNTSELRRKLREKWELASVLNFLHGAMDAYLLHWPENSRVTKGAGETVFEPVMKTKLKLSAEDIETGLIEFNDSLVQLHIALLKGITKSKFLDGSEAWVLALSRVLQSWWPWVAEGDFPLSTTKGEELSRYKKLDPTIRLLVLKSVCEVRATQDDIVSFINESIKVETEVSKFRKEKLADENGTAYWYDGNEIIGHRLYKEVHQFGKQIKLRGKKAISDIYSQWETVATNLEEFHCVMDEFASSELKSEVSVSKTLGVKVIPALEKIEKKKQRALKQLENQNAVPCAYLSSRLTRSSRNSKPISYTYDEYDKAIKEAIKVTQNQKIGENPRSGMHRTASTEVPHEILDSPPDSSSESDSDIDGHLGGNDVDYSSDDVDDSSDGVCENEEDITDVDKDEASDFDEQSNNLRTRGEIGCSIHIPRGSRFSNRLARIAGHGAPESINVNAKNRLRQRPSVNTAFECSVPDSEEEQLSNSSSKYIVPHSEDEQLSNSSSKKVVPDSEEENSSNSSSMA